MADILKDSFVESNLFRKVLFQRGRVITDYEFNEFQDDLRVPVYRTMFAGVQEVSTSVPGATTLNPGSNDNGYLCVGTSASNQLTVDAGFLFCDGQEVPVFTPFTLTGFTTPGSDRTDTVYLAVTEAEVSDPAQLPAIGETTRRRQLQVTVLISTTGHGGVPSNTVADIWEGGIHYFMIADVARHTGVSTIAPGDVTDLRFLLPSSLISAISVQAGGIVTAVKSPLFENILGAFTLTDANLAHHQTMSSATSTNGDQDLRLGHGEVTTIESILQKVNAGVPVVCGNGTTTFGDFNGTGALDAALAATVAAGTPVKIYLKKGTYTFSAARSLTNTMVSIEGVGSADVNITSTVAGSGPIWTNPGKLFLQGVTLTRTSGTNLAFSMPAGTTLALNDVVFSDLDVLMTNPGVPNAGGAFFRATQCQFAPTTASTIAVELDVDDAATRYGMIFEDCLFNCGAETTPVRLGTTGGIVSKTIVKGIFFNRCRYALGVTSTTSRQVTTNVGVLAIEPGGSGKLLEIHDITFNDCNVKAGVNGSVTNPSALLAYIHPVGTAGTNAGHAAVIKEVSINGGVWDTNAQASKVVPLFICAQRVITNNVKFVGPGAAGNNATGVAPVEADCAINGGTGTGSAVPDFGTFTFSVGASTVGGKQAIHEITAAQTSGNNTIVVDSVANLAINDLIVIIDPTNGSMLNKITNIVSLTLTLNTNLTFNVSTSANHGRAMIGVYSNSATQVPDDIGVMMKDTYITNMPQSTGGSADLRVDLPGYMQSLMAAGLGIQQAACHSRISNVVVSQYVPDTGAGTQPNYRINFQAAYMSAAPALLNAVLSQVMAIGCSTGTQSQRYAVTAVVNLPYADGVTVEDCAVQGFYSSGGGGAYEAAGFQVVNSQVDNYLGDGGVTIVQGTTVPTSVNMTLARCKTFACNVGLFLNGSQYKLIDGVQVLGGDYSKSTGGSGILQTGYMGTITISKARCMWNSGYGIVFSPTHTGAWARAFVIDNDCSFNVGSGSVVIAFLASGGSDEFTGNCTGNICILPNGSQGKIQVQSMGGAASATGIMGLETEYVVGGLSSQTLTSGNTCLHNFATLQTP